MITSASPVWGQKNLRLLTVHCLHGSPCEEQSGAILGEKMEDQAEEACSFELAAVEPCIIYTNQSHMSVHPHA